MGARDSKSCCISYEEASKRLKESDLKRLKEAFKQVSSLNGIITRQAFIKEVLGDFVPLKLAEHIFQACGGTNKGISFRELLCGLVILTKGTQLEKYKFLFSLCANEAGTHVYKHDMYKLVQACDGGIVSDKVASCFNGGDKVTFEEFKSWLGNSEHGSSLTIWLLNDDTSMRAWRDYETPTFYQTLAGVTHLEEKDIIELEKRYWLLKTKSKTGKFDIETFGPLVSPVIPVHLIEGVFNAFDENQDGHIDFKEMACGISACCRGPLVERLKFCFKIFDPHHNNALSRTELWQMVYTMLYVQQESCLQPGRFVEFNAKEVDKLTDEILSSSESEKKTTLTLDEYLVLTVGKTLPQNLLSLLFQVCHVLFGLRPSNKEEESDIIRGWLEREEKRKLQVGQLWYLISMHWWKPWNDYIDYKGASYLSDSFKRNAKLQKKIDGSVAQTTDDGGNVVLSSVTSLNDESPDQQKSSLTMATSSFGPRNPSESSLNGVATKKTNGLQSFSDIARTPNSSPSLSRKLIIPQQPSMIDNSSLILPNTQKVLTISFMTEVMVLTQEGGKLRKDVVRGVDYEIVPESLWLSLFQWYGGAISLPRLVILPPASDTPELELDLLALKLFRHQVNTSPKQGVNTWPGPISSAYVGGSTPIPCVQPLPTTPKRYLAFMASFSRLAHMRQVFDFLCKRLRLRPEDTRLWFYKDDSNLILIEDEMATLEQLNIQDYEQILIEVRNKDQTWPEEMSYLINAKLDQKSQGPTEKGATGLNNLGNTCFMNAALQCVSNTKTLTQYFITNKHLYELNRNNPLGMKGHMAKRYGDLIQDLWSGTSRTIAPLKLRWTIGKYAPRFSGFQQHDSQELLAFLIDGLHEDLNRVHEKPYVELKDSDGRPDNVVAKESWENHVVRNRSIIVDLFHGQLQSTVKCKVCGHISLRFDPFNYLSLPLPMESCVHMEVVVIKLDGSIPVKYGLRLNHDDKYSMLKLQLGNLCRIPPMKLLLVELNGSSIRSLYCEDHKVKVANNSYIFAYEAAYSMLSFEEEMKNVHSCGEIHRPALEGIHKKPPEESSVSRIGDYISPESDNNGNSHTPTVINSNNLVNGNGGSSSGSSSMCSSIVSNYSITELPEFNPGKNYLVAYHRKMMRQDIYFLYHQKTKPTLFGLPLILPYGERTTYSELYQLVWCQVARLVSPLPPAEPGAPLNHAQDCDDSLGYEYPFTLRVVTKEGLVCAWCPWYRYCQGCRLNNTPTHLRPTAGYLAIDWDPTALHLRYQASQEMAFVEHESVEKSRRQQVEPISLHDCLEAFTKEEDLGESEKYFCSKCDKHQLASKKLQIYKLPPVLIIHLKRFQLVNLKWVKSHKIVRFPFSDFDPIDYMAPTPQRFQRGAPEMQKEATEIHQHKLLSNADPTTVKYRLYALACHSGILGGGHYVCYACNPNNKWYCYNDSSCKEVQPEPVDSAYMLFYEREGIDPDQYMPDVTGKEPDTHDVDDEFDTDLRKLCCLQ